MNKIKISSTFVLILALLSVHDVIDNDIIESFLIFFIWGLLFLGFFSHIILFFSLKKIKLKSKINTKKIALVLLFKKIVVQVINVASIYSFYIKGYKNLSYFMSICIVIMILVQYFLKKNKNFIN